MALNRKQKDSKKRKTLTAQSWIDKTESDDRSCIVLPKGAKLFNPKKEEATFRLAVVPFTCGKGNPVRAEGELHYERTYYTHSIPKPDGTRQNVICNFKNFKKPCAVCDYLGKLAQNPDRDESTDAIIKEFKVKQRQVWGIYDYDKPKQGVLIFDISYYLFGIHLRDKIVAAKDPKKRERYQAFADPVDGALLEVGTKLRSMGKNNFLEFSAIDIEPRTDETALPESILEDAPCLDDCIKPAKYDEIKKLLLGGTKDEDDEEDEEDDPETEEEDEEDEESNDSEESDDDEESDDPEDNEESVDEEDEQSDDDDDPDEDELAVDDKVSFMLKGKRKIGTIRKIKGELALIKGVPGVEGLVKIKLEKLTKAGPVKPKKEDDDFDFDEDDEEEEKPVKEKKKPKKEKDDDDEVPF